MILSQCAAVRSVVHHSETSPDRYLPPHLSDPAIL